MKVRHSALNGRRNRGTPSWGPYPPTPSKARKVFEINDLSLYFLFEKPTEGGRGEGLALFPGLFSGTRMSSPDANGKTSLFVSESLESVTR
jgi:hypothetical protein